MKTKPSSPHRLPLITLALSSALASLTNAATLSVSPASTSNTYAGVITLQIGNLTNTEAVVVQEFLDANRNGSVDAGELLGQPAHILAAMAERLRKRRSAYEAVFRALVALAAAKPKDDAVAELLKLPDPEAYDLAALDAAWEDEPVQFGPGANDGCKDGLIARVRGGLRPAPDMPPATRNIPPRP